MNNEVNNVQDVNSALNINNESVVQQSVSPQESSVQNNIEPPKKKGNKKLLIIIIIVVIIGCGIFVFINKDSLFNKTDNNTSNDVNKEDNNSNQNSNDDANSTYERNLYKNTVEAMISDFSRAVTIKMGENNISSPENNRCATDNVYNITTSNSKEYYYMCMTLKQLYNEGYTRKNISQNEGGYIQMWIPTGTGEVITFVNVTNGKYYVQGYESNISKSNFISSENPYGGSEIEKPNSSTTCPQSCTIIPNSTITNIQE